MTATIPVRDKLFRETEDGPTLLAGQCAECGRIVFPASGTVDLTVFPA